MRKRLPAARDFPATRDAYVRMTRDVRALTDHLPGGAAALAAPTVVCAAAYGFALAFLLVRRDARLVRAVFVPAACFLAATALRPVIGRERPYDRFDSPPVGRYRRGKGKSMPSRHAASAAAIACAVVYALPHPATALLMLLLTLVIAALRVLAGQHYASDAAAAVAMSFLLSAAGYLL